MHISHLVELVVVSLFINFMVESVTYRACSLNIGIKINSRVLSAYGCIVIYRFGKLTRETNLRQSAIYFVFLNMIVHPPEVNIPSLRDGGGQGSVPLQTSRSLKGLGQRDKIATDLNITFTLNTYPKGLENYGITPMIT